MKTKKTDKPLSDIFAKRKKNNPYAPSGAEIHVYGKDNKVKCQTDSKGYPTPGNKDPQELIINSSEGFIPLWAENVNLRWRFSPGLYHFFKNPQDALNGIRGIFAKGLLEWGDSVPIKFSERDDNWDFEITVSKDRCDDNGCVLASAFFPDGGRHELVIYEKLFSLPVEEQIETMAHELGHIFGLRHFFANISEKAYLSVPFGSNDPFTIMNYGDKSEMTENDRKDLKALYEKVWSGELTEINGTRIVTFQPYHVLGGVK